MVYIYTLILKVHALLRVTWVSGDPWRFGEAFDKPGRPKSSRPLTSVGIWCPCPSMPLCHGWAHHSIGGHFWLARLHLFIKLQQEQQRIKHLRGPVKRHSNVNLKVHKESLGQFGSLVTAKKHCSRCSQTHQPLKVFDRF